MRIKRIITMCLAFCGLFALTGCQLAKENAGLANNGNRLIGVFVTKEYLDLFDMEGYLNDNINKLADGGENILDGNISKYQGRLYAILKTRVLTENIQVIQRTPKSLFLIVSMASLILRLQFRRQRMRKILLLQVQMKVSATGIQATFTVMRKRVSHWKGQYTGQ